MRGDFSSWCVLAFDLRSNCVYCFYGCSPSKYGDTLSLTGRTRDLGVLLNGFLTGLIEAIIAGFILGRLEKLAKYLAPRVSALWTLFKIKSFTNALRMSSVSVMMVQELEDSRLSPLVPFMRLFLAFLLRLLPFVIQGVAHLSKMRLAARPYPYSHSNRPAYVQWVKEHPPDQPTMWFCLAVLFLAALKGVSLYIVAGKSRGKSYR